jgi:hypothetical protein
MNRTELIDDAKRGVKAYIERELEARGETMVLPVINIKLDHDPEGEWDGIHNAVLVSADEKTGDVHIYLMTCIMHREVIEKMFETRIDDFVGHIVVKEEEDEKYSKIIENFSLDKIHEEKISEEEKKKTSEEKKKMRFQRWSNI